MSYLLSSVPLGSWTVLVHGHFTQGWHWLLYSQSGLSYLWRADPALHHPWLVHPVSPISSLTLSSTLLDCLCPVTLLFQQKWRRLKSAIRTGACDLGTYLVGTQGTRTVCQPDTWLLLLVSTAVRGFSYSAKHLYFPYINSRRRKKYPHTHSTCAWPLCQTRKFCWIQVSWQYRTSSGIR